MEAVVLMSYFYEAVGEEPISSCIEETCSSLRGRSGTDDIVSSILTLCTLLSFVDITVS